MRRHTRRRAQATFARERGTAGTAPSADVARPAPAPARRSPDRGSTLTELIITVMLLGLITSSLASAVIVIVRQQDNATGRLNVARAESNLALWLPADLASAEDVDESPNASPCGTTCPPNAITGGSNAMMLTWHSLEQGPSGPVESEINVAYRYLQEGLTFQLVRVECISVASGPWQCSNTVVLRDLDSPPPGVTWTPGVTAPTWVLEVSDPMGPADPTGTTVPFDPSAPNKNAQRVIVTVNGGGDAVGAGGGLNQITLSAGGTNRGTISADSTAGTPSFTAARSRCGGSYGIIVDDSGSIGGEMPTIIAGLQAFLDNFAGTPVKLQVVRFDATASVIGETPRNRYFDMLNEADVIELRAALNELFANGGTNWEDGLHRMFFTETGAVQSVVPETVLFFTDGQPTWNRRWATSSPAAPTEPPVATPELNSYSSYDQESFNRAKQIVDQFRSSVNFIGVGVGPSFSGSSDWLSLGAGWHYNYFRGFHHEGRDDSYSPWYPIDQATYEASPPDQRQIAYSWPYDFWEPTTKDEYDLLPSDGRRRDQEYAMPYESYDVTSTSTPNSTILTRLIAGNDNGEPAVSVNGAYTNADLANMYLLPDFNQFAGALEAVALAECGGTLTVQTRENGQPAEESFSYQHTGTTDSGGLPAAHTATTITTTKDFRSGTFDFSIPSANWITVEIQPVATANVAGYASQNWTCKAGPDARSVETFPIEGMGMSGIRLQIRANEAVSCRHDIVG